MSSSSSFLVYFHGACTLDDAERALRGTALTITRDGGSLAARWGSGPELHVGLSTEAWVAIEAREQAERHAIPELATCDRRFEVAFEDLGAVLDEYNTLAEVQLTLQDLTKGFVALSWNGELIRPE